MRGHDKQFPHVFELVLDHNDEGILLCEKSDEVQDCHIYRHGYEDCPEWSAPFFPSVETESTGGLFVTMGSCAYSMNGFAAHTQTYTHS